MEASYPLLTVVHGLLIAVPSLLQSKALGDWASVVAARGLSSCGAQTWLLCGMWNPPGPGIKPVSPASAGSFPSTVPPGKSDPCFTNEKTKAWETWLFVHKC